MGDSILNGYLPAVVKEWAGTANVDAWVNPYHQASPQLLRNVLSHGPYGTRLDYGEQQDRFTSVHFVLRPETAALLRPRGEAGQTGAENGFLGVHASAPSQGRTDKAPGILR